MDDPNQTMLLSTLHRGVLVTRRREDLLQTSPIVGATDEQGRFLISSRQTAYKVRNLRREPRSTLCLFVDEFFGPWLQVDGNSAIVDLPDALPLLVATYRRISGEHPNWVEFESAMISEDRVIIAVDIDSIGPARAG